MQRKKPRPASMDEVKIRRDHEYAVIDYADEAIGGMQLPVGREIANVSDQDILALHNEVVAAMQVSADAWDDVVIEIPVGKEQLTFHPETDHWSPRGDVVRCVIEDDGYRRPGFIIDDHELSLEEFGQLIVTHAGWGMRIALVPDDRTHVNPRVEVREPEEGER